jgi:hypothetical protein
VALLVSASAFTFFKKSLDPMFITSEQTGSNKCSVRDNQASKTKQKKCNRARAEDSTSFALDDIFKKVELQLDGCCLCKTSCEVLDLGNDRQSKFISCYCLPCSEVRPATAIHLGNMLLSDHFLKCPSYLSRHLYRSIED